MIQGFIGGVPNGFDTPEPVCDLIGTPPPPPPTTHYRHTQEEVDKRATLPPNLTAHDVLSVGKTLHSKSTTLPARTHFGIGSMLGGDDLSSVEWSTGMKGNMFTAELDML